MFNLPVKFAALSRPYFALSPQVFLDRSPEDSLAIFKAVLPDHCRQQLEFAFTDAAILMILEREFEVRLPHHQMVFLKPDLGAESWLVANGYPEPPVPGGSMDPLYELARHLDEMYGEMIPYHQPRSAILAVQEELKTLLLLYVFKYGQGNTDALYQLSTRAGIERFLNLVVAEAIFKYDGAKVLFGFDSRYTKLWKQKQHHFLMLQQYLQSGRLQHSA